MIVDDHAPARAMIRRFLSVSSVTFCECASGEEAVQRAPEFKPDWVTMDLHMPGINGFDATEALRAIHPPARVLIVTSDPLPEHYERSREVGAETLLPKDDLVVLRLMLMHQMFGGKFFSA
jgi:DNA-binding NarL/FixJ family response regulator